MISIAGIMSSVLPGTFVPDMRTSEAPSVAPIPAPSNPPADFDRTSNVLPAAPASGAASSASDSALSDGSGTVPSLRGDTTFKDTVKQLLGNVNDALNTSDQNARDLADGKTNDFNKVVTSVEEANLALQYTMAIRTKLLEAYTSVQTMAV